MPKNSVLYTYLLFLIVFLGITLRVLGIFNDLWLDEIWALKAAATMESILDPFTVRSLDGHASIYTVIMHYMGPGYAGWVYRLPALTLSVLGFSVIYLILRREHGLFSLLLLTLYSFSYVFVLYGSEARGYSFILTLSLFSFWIIKEFSLKNKFFVFPLFWIVSICGFLFHYSFIQFYTALTIWSLFIMLKGLSHRGLLRFIYFFTIPSIFIALIYLTQIRFMQHGSGPLGSYADVVINSLSMSLGGPEISALAPKQGALIIGLSVLIFFILAREIFLLIRAKNEDGFFYLLIIFIVPVLFVLILQPRVLLLRYFLVSLLFSLFIFASFLRRMFEGRAKQRFLACAAVFFIFYGNLTHIIKFLNNGRGEYAEAISYIASQTDSDKITIASDHDFRNQMLIDFYSAKLNVKDRVFYTEQGRQEDSVFDWYLLHSQDSKFKPPKVIRLNESDFLLRKTFEYTALSGWDWHIYRRASSLPLQ